MLSTISNLNLTRILLLGILIRVLIMPFYFHPDIKTYNFQSSFLRQGVFNIYSYLQKNKERLTLKEEFVYFPLTYFSVGIYQIVMSPLLGDGFNDWLSDASQTASERVGVYRYLFLLKLPYLLLDLVIAFLLMSFFPKELHKKRAFALWLLNPFSILLIYVFSNVDIMPVLFTVLSLLLALRNKLLLAAFLLGVAAGFKGYPLLFIPFLVLYGKHLREKIQMVFVSLGTFFIIVLPFLGSPGFSEAALVSGLTTRLLTGGINIGFGESLIFGVVGLAILFFYRSTMERNINILIYDYLFVLLLVYSFIHLHIQWFLWVIPFVVLVAAVKRNLLSIFVFIGVIGFAIPFLYSDKYMSVALFTVISPLYNQLPLPADVFGRLYDVNVLQGILHSIFLGGSLVVFGRLFKDFEYES